MDNVDKILDWIKEQPEYTTYPVTSEVSLFYHVAPMAYAKLIERYVSAQPVSDVKGVEEETEDEEPEGINIFFSNTEKNTMTVNCFDEDSEMSIIIWDNGNRSIYSMTIWEVKQLKKWFNEHLKNEK